MEFRIPTGIPEIRGRARQGRCKYSQSIDDFARIHEGKGNNGGLRPMIGLDRGIAKDGEEIARPGAWA